MLRALKKSLESTGMVPKALRDSGSAPSQVDDQKLKDDSIAVVVNNECKMEKIYKDNAYIPSMLHIYIYIYTHTDVLLNETFV